MQFGLMPGNGTTDAIFIMRQVQEKHQAKKKKLYYAVVDLEKAFDRGSLMKEAWLKTSKQVCGMTKCPTRHKETWWWNRDVEKRKGGCQTKGMSQSLAEI